MNVSTVGIWIAIVYTIAAITRALVKLAIAWLLTRAKPNPAVLAALPAILEAVDSPRSLARLGKRRQP